MMQKATILFAVLLGGVILAQSPVIKVTGDMAVSEWTIGRLKVDQPKDNAAYVWDIFPIAPLTDDAASVIELNNEVLFTGPPGRYRFICTEITMLNGRPVVNRFRSTITVVAQKPQPPPDVDPNPPKPEPQPQPTKQQLTLVVVEERSDAWPFRATYLQSMYQFFKDGGHVIRLADKDAKDENNQTPKGWVDWFARAQGKQLPYAFVIPKSGGKILWQGTLPNHATGDSAALIAQMKALGG